MKGLTGLEVARFLGKSLAGEKVAVHQPANLEECGPHDLVWVKSYTPERLKIIETRRPALTICDAETASKTTVPHIVSTNPRLDFIRILQKFFTEAKEASIHPTAIIEQGARIGNRVSIGAYARIGKKVTIGDDCVVGSGVALEGEVSLGRNCVIKPNSVIGGWGFGFEYDEDGKAQHFPHLGKIVIEDDVWIGACSTVEIGTLGATKICQGCKIDDLVQVGHNVTVGPHTLVMANTVICGGAIIGARCWVAPNSVIKEKVVVGNGVTIGLGSVVIRNVADNDVVAGVPAKPLKAKGA